METQYENITQDVEQGNGYQEQQTNPVGTEGSSPQAVTPNAADNQAGGPNQMAAETRRAAEAYQRLQSDQSWAEFQEFKRQQEAERIAQEAQQNQVSPEVWNKLTQMEQLMMHQEMQRQFAEAQRGFQSFAEEQGMDVNTQTEYLGWLENQLGPQLAAQAAKPGFNYGLYVDAFARHKGLLGQPAQRSNAPVYVPGHGSGAGQANTLDQELANRIKERVKGY